MTCAEGQTPRSAYARRASTLKRSELLIRSSSRTSGLHCRTRCSSEHSPIPRMPVESAYPTSANGGYQDLAYIANARLLTALIRPFTFKGQAHREPALLAA